MPLTPHTAHVNANAARKGTSLHPSTTTYPPLFTILFQSSLIPASERRADKSSGQNSLKPLPYSCLGMFIPRDMATYLAEPTLELQDSHTYVTARLPCLPYKGSRYIVGSELKRPSSSLPSSFAVLCTFLPVLMLCRRIPPVSCPGRDVLIYTFYYPWVLLYILQTSLAY